MEKMGIKRMLALFMAVFMLVGLLPAYAFAEEVGYSADLWDNGIPFADDEAYRLHASNLAPDWDTLSLQMVAKDGREQYSVTIPDTAYTINGDEIFLNLKKITEQVKADVGDQFIIHERYYLHIDLEVKDADGNVIQSGYRILVVQEPWTNYSFQDGLGVIEHNSLWKYIDIQVFNAANPYGRNYEAEVVDVEVQDPSIATVSQDEDGYTFFAQSKGTTAATVTYQMEDTTGSYEIPLYVQDRYYGDVWMKGHGAIVIGTTSDITYQTYGNQTQEDWFENKLMPGDTLEIEIIDNEKGNPIPGLTVHATADPMTMQFDAAGVTDSYQTVYGNIIIKDANGAEIYAKRNVWLGSIQDDDLFVELRDANGNVLKDEDFEMEQGESILVSPHLIYRDQTSTQEVSAVWNVEVAGVTASPDSNGLYSIEMDNNNRVDLIVYYDTTDRGSGSEVYEFICHRDEIWLDIDADSNHYWNDNTAVSFAARKMSGTLSMNDVDLRWEFGYWGENGPVYVNADPYFTTPDHETAVLDLKAFAAAFEPDQDFTLLVKVTAVYNGTDLDGWQELDYTIEAKQPVVTKTDISKATVSTIKSVTYTGKAQKPSFTVKVGKTTLKKGTDYTVEYANNKKVGTATVTIKGKGDYTGTIKKTFKITKAKQPMTAKAKTVTLKVKDLKKKAQTVKIAKAVTIKKAQGAVTYKITSKGKLSKVKINSKTGTITVPKGTKKGTYKIKVKATAKGNGSYKSGSKTVTVTIKVK